jgi:hypothetical protein
VTTEHLAALATAVWTVSVWARPNSVTTPTHVRPILVMHKVAAVSKRRSPAAGCPVRLLRTASAPAPAQRLAVWTTYAQSNGWTAAAATITCHVPWANNARLAFASRVNPRSAATTTLVRPTPAMPRTANASSKRFRTNWPVATGCFVRSTMSARAVVVLPVQARTVTTPILAPGTAAIR